MECKKITQIGKSIHVFQKCNCYSCTTKREANKKFWERFDLAYEKHLSALSDNPAR